MRTIKFRAWLVNQMLYMSELSWSGFWDTADQTYPDAPILMQFTGLFDKNGKEIYEGDIVKYPQGIGSIEWIEQANMLGYHIERDGGGNPITQYANRTVIEYVDIEIIGNIYENNDLLPTQSSNE